MLLSYADEIVVGASDVATDVEILVAVRQVLRPYSVNSLQKLA